MTKAKGWIPGFGWGSPSASWSPSGRRWSESWPRASWDSSNRTAPGLFHRRAGFRQPLQIQQTRPCSRRSEEIQSGSTRSWPRSLSADPLGNDASCESFPSQSTSPWSVLIGFNYIIEVLEHFSLLDTFKVIRLRTTWKFSYLISLGNSNLSRCVEMNVRLRVARGFSQWSQP